MPIKKVYLCSDSTPSQYKKLFRKALMTGGAVLELDPSIGKKEAMDLLALFQKDAVENGVQELVVDRLKSEFAL